MSNWIEQTQNVEVTIRTGDGRLYEVLWIGARRTIAFNYSAYNFIGQRGTLVDRREAESPQYTLNIKFEGLNHLQVANNFFISAKDPRPWTITHPYYGEFVAQPLTMQQVNDSLNISEFAITIWETIPRNRYPVEREIASDTIDALRQQGNENAVANFAALTPVISPLTRATANASLVEMQNTITPAITDDQANANFRTLISRASEQINNALNPPIDSARAFLAIINYPIAQIQDVRSRYNVLRELHRQLQTTILGSINGREVTAEDALFYQTVGSAILFALANSAVTPGPNDYGIRSEVAGISDELETEYNTYLANIDEIQADRSDRQGTFTPDDLTNRTLNDAIVATLSSLFDVAFEARQERIILLEHDSNAIVLAHRFYGTDLNDDNLNFFIDSNGLTLDELIQIKTGREIRYYI